MNAYIDILMSINLNIRLNIECYTKENAGIL